MIENYEKRPMKANMLSAEDEKWNYNWSHKDRKATIKSRLCNNVTTKIEHGRNKSIDVEKLADKKLLKTLHDLSADGSTISDLNDSHNESSYTNHQKNTEANFGG